MAELLLSPLVEALLDKLASGFWKELGLLGGVKKDVRKLQSTLSTIKSVLEDAEQRSITEKPLLDWLKKLKDAAYDADDLVDELQTEALRAKARGHLKEKVTDFFSSHNPVVFCHKIALKIKDVWESLNEIAEERTKFHLAQAPASARERNEETHSVVVPSEVYGREEDKETIVNYLLNKDMDKVLSVIAVVGLGGLGKTTLAQLVYNDERIKSLFDLIAWVCVSDEFDVKVTTRKIIQSMTKEASCNDLDLALLGQRLQEILGGKKFILVLDDVWNEDRQKWERLESLLRWGEKGSKVMVTTRSEQVASVMGSILIYKLKPLSTDDCWMLFRERAFGLGGEEETQRLIEIGKKIVNKGGGLPLAAKALGSLMSSKRGEREWSAIENSEIWRLPDDENEILPALRLSYYHLPAHVKKCFVYCSLFPKDYDFDKEKLISLWLREGFIQSSSQGSKYFNSLSRRSFFEVDNGKETCKMHDLIHDLACHAGKDEFCMIEVCEDEVKVLDNCRYLSLNMYLVWSSRVLRISCETNKLRSLMLIKINAYLIGDFAWDTLLQLHRIRLLDLSWSRISTLPSTLCRLKHLRFLDLSRTNIEALPLTIGSMYNLSTLILADCSRLRELPSTLCTLPNLSTLNLSGCYNLGGLPGGMSKMKDLIHLDLKRCDELREMPPSMGRLTNLQTMNQFVVGEKDGCRVSELKHLNQLGGRLGIVNLHKVKSPAEAKEAGLGAKMNVRNLELRWGTWRERRGNERAAVGEEESVAENLRPPPNLESLEIEDYNGIKVPSWWMQTTSSSLFQNLVSLRLSGLKWCEGLPTLGQLPLLKELEIEGMEGVRRIGGEEIYGRTEAEAGGGSSLFPKLESLVLREMRNLEEWVVEAGNIPRERMFPSLGELYIEECPKLRLVVPGLPMSLVDLNISGSSELISAGCFAGLSRLQSLIILMPAALLLAEGGLRHLTALETLVIHGEYDGPTIAATTCLPDGMLECHIPSLRALVLRNLRSLTSLGQSRDSVRTDSAARDSHNFVGGARTNVGGPADPVRERRIRRVRAGSLPGEQQRIGSAPPPLFTSLKQLCLESCGALTVLPEWIGCLTSLQQLYLMGCTNLEMLPAGLQRLTSLQKLHLLDCPKLEMLPSELEHLTY